MENERRVRLMIRRGQDRHACFARMREEGEALIFAYSDRGGEGEFPVVLRLGGGRMEITREGEMKGTLVLEPGKRHAFAYETPYGSWPMEARCSALSFSREGRRAEAAYEIFSAGERTVQQVMELIWKD